MTAEEAIKEVQRIGPLVEQLRGRMMWAERMCRMLGQDFIDRNASEHHLNELARRANMISNARREVTRHLKRYGNEFAREPYLEDPE